MNKNKAIIIFILFSSSGDAFAEYDCNLLIGKWGGEIVNKDLNYYDKYEQIFMEDNEFVLKTESYALNGDGSDEFVGEGVHVDKGVWRCDGESVYIKINLRDGYFVDGMEKSYKIIELTDVYHKYRTTKGYAVEYLGSE